MLQNANLLMLDQPTNHLDLESITALNNGLKDYKSNILIASHDHELLQTVANRVIQITPEGIVDRRTSFDEFIDNM
jgi:ATPase subunit of ABC transporter with duplicated ATPase domains